MRIASRRRCTLGRQTRHEKQVQAVMSHHKPILRRDRGFRRDARIVCGVCCRQTLDQKWQQVARNLDQIANDAIQKPETTSLALAVVTRDANEWSKNYGYADAQKESAAN